MKTKLLQYLKTPALFLALSCATTLNAQTAPAWVQFAGPAEYANYDTREVCVGVDTAGNVYTAASAYDTVNNLDKSVLVKYNSAGVQQWIKFYDNANLPNNEKSIVALLVDKAGNSYLCGYGKNSAVPGTSIDYLVMKYDNTGFQQWVKYWDGGNSDRDYITCASFDAAGNIVVGGYVEGGANGNDMGVVKYGISGTQMWSYVYNNSVANGEDRPLSIASDASNNIFLTGSSYGTNARDMITIKLNSSGANQWTKLVTHASSGNDERGYGITTDAAGNCYATGAVGDWITIKYDPSGTVLWTNHYTANGLNSDNVKKVMLDKHNGVILAGDAFVSGGGHFSDLVVFKLDNATGQQMWSVSIDNGGIDKFGDAVLDTSGTVYIGGDFEGPLGGDMSAMIISSGGGVMWNTTYSNPSRAAGKDNPYQVAVDRNRNFYMAGLAERRGSGSDDAVDIITLKYSTLVTGIKENTLNHINLNIYPNPAKDNLTVSFTEQNMLGSTISITNMVGEVVIKETLNTLNQQIKLDQLSEGIYLVRVTNGTSVATGKLIIK